MNPARISLLSTFLIGAFFTLLLIIGDINQVKLPEKDSSAAQESAKLLSNQLDKKLSALQKSMEALTYNAFWQSSPVAEWSYWLQSQSTLYKTAGLTKLGVHSSTNNVLYMDSPSRPGLLGELKQPIERVYQDNNTISLLQIYNDQPAIVILSPIKNIDGEIIGSLIGIKYLDTELLKSFHYMTRVAVAVTKNGVLQSTSIESSPNLASYELVEVPWPKSINSTIWKMILLVEPAAPISMMHVYLIVGAILTLILMFIIFKQVNAASKNITLLDDTLDIKLPLVEQMNRLNTLHNLAKDHVFASLIQSVKQRLEQLVQQKKALAVELRKSQESENKLKAHASSLSNERDIAVAAPKVKSEFLSRMGDEITTPMKSVVSMLKLLSEYDFDSEPKQLLNIAKRSTRTLVDNLNNILDFSKLDANMLKLAPRKFSVRELVDDLSSELSHYANEKGLSLQASSDPEIPSQVKADLTRIRQILRNLLGNAIRFTKSGEVTLYADMVEKDGENLLRFTVKDSGVGIPVDAQKGLFDSLEQQTKLTNSSFAGRLRLIVSKYLAELMGGEIGVISEQGKGSQFWFTVKIS
ncbi:HAMP domain-containing sensor histidine kinase [Aliikangiella sp. G2MR2-5]|uniref:sensor histidine kinase n=1 Tax=Aliikangiella sp. G2MR2-5 TaxID=2788943 RepID=UPI0018A8ED35|nr:ATP-binding protein [Aliikangiella sp. G2MR2-5]